VINNLYGSLSIRDSSITSNLSTLSNSILLISAYLDLSDTLLEDNLANSTNNGITLIQASLFAERVQVSYSREAQQEAIRPATGFLLLQFQSRVIIKDSQFSRLGGGRNAFMSCSEESSVTLVGVTVTDAIGLDGAVINLN